MKDKFFRTLTNPKSNKEITLLTVGGYGLLFLFTLILSLAGAPKKLILISLIVTLIGVPILMVIGYYFNEGIKMRWKRYIRFSPGLVTIEHGDGHITEIKFSELEEIQVIPDKLFKTDTKLKLYYKNKPATYINGLLITNAYEIKNEFKRWKMRISERVD